MVMASAEEKPAALNRLGKEKSPYLLLHADNPVDWYPWGKEAFAKAKKENKPILLSIGYSTCHWCHVMERESFQNKEIAALLNKHFVAIKLDREERPDVDQLYMKTYQAMTGDSGGWPLNVFLTPDLKMFTGGTYFPPTSRGGRPGFDKVLKNINDVWQKDSDKIKKEVKANYIKFGMRLNELSTPVAGSGKDALTSAATHLMAGFDAKEGGWNPSGPKFPQPSNLRMMLLEWKQSKDLKLLAAVELTAQKMAHGGVYDHLSGGFHRYAVDGKWLVPHFEKMLYDQAQLLDLYVELWQITKKEEYKRVAVEIATYVVKEMQGQHGGYFCAQDAQSEHKEGKFACWTTVELKKLLSAAEYAVVVRHFGITEKGNFYDHSDPEALKNQNVLSLPNGRVEETGKDKAALMTAIEKMRAARMKRIPAATDDKVLASWNGMMIGAMARAGVAFDDSLFLASAKNAYAEVVEKLWDEKSKTLNHRWRDGHADTSQQVSSYLWMVHGARSLYQATLEPQYLDLAVQLADKSLKLFADPVKGGFFESAKSDDIVLRLKSDYDGALPVASSVAGLEYYVLSQLTGREDFDKISQGCIDSQGQMLANSPESTCYLLLAVYHQTSNQPKLVIAGKPGKETRAFLKVVAQGYFPAVVVSGNKGEVLSAFTKSLPMVDEKHTAYYCLGKVCKKPVTEPKELLKLLKAQ